MKVIALRSGDKLTLILGGKHITKTGSIEYIKEIYEAALRYKATQTQDDLDELNMLLNPITRHVKHGILEYDDTTGKFYLGKSKIPLPDNLLKRFVEYIEEGYPTTALENFWNLACLNPNTVARDKFFDYCDTYGVTITDNGYAVLYKAVTHKELVTINEDLAAFVAQAVIIARRQKKGLHTFSIYRSIDTNGLRLTRGEGQPHELPMGTLDELHKELRELSSQSRTVYTDKHSKTMDIKLGVPVVKEREECDPNINNECSYGLHVGSYKYVRSHFTRSGDTVFACLVNPMNVVAIPTYDTSKMRVCEYLPYAIMEMTPEGDWQELDSPYFESDYKAYEVAELEAMLEDLEQMGGTIAEEQKDIIHNRLVYLYPQDDSERPDTENLEYTTDELSNPRFTNWNSAYN
jgi:hypothetical protein